MISDQFNSKARPLAVIATLSFLIPSSCLSGPDQITTYRSPNSSVYYTVETSHGHGPVSNNYTDIYGHFEHGGFSDRQLALNGPYLENTKVTWTSPTDVEFCIGGGSTIEFRNHLYLSTKDNAYINMHERLDETCQRDPVSTSPQGNAK